MNAVVTVPVATVWTSPDAPRDLDAQAVADRPDVAAWTAGLTGEDRRGLHGRTLTQGLLGEPVEVVEEAGDWLRVRLPWQPQGGTGYAGWVRAAHVGDGPDAPGTDVVAVQAPTATCATVHGEPLLLSYGTVLPLEDEGSVRLPDGSVGRLDPADLRRPDADPLADDLLVSARRFLGLPYLWGGCCGWGLDCSGLVHLVHRVHGVRVPRDASDQHDVARTVRDAAPGGLYFFARPGQRAYHVGFVTEPGMLHAPESGPGAGGVVEDGPLAAHRREHLVGAGTFVR